MPSELASAKLGKSPESYEQSEQCSQTLERMRLSAEACLFIPGCGEHGGSGAVKATSEQGQLSDGQRCLVSKHLPSGTQVHTYEHMVILS